MADITMPQLGETVTEGTITKWFKQVGDEIGEDEVLFEVSTDKVDSEVPSPVSGFVTEILVPEGETVDVGVKLAVIGDAPPDGSGEAKKEAESEPEPTKESEPEEKDEDAAEPEPADEEPEPEAEEEPEPEKKPEKKAEPEAKAARPPGEAASEKEPVAEGSAGEGEARVAQSSTDSKLLSPVVRRLIAEHEIDPGTITGTGAGGRITRNDVLAVIEKDGGAKAEKAPADKAPAESGPAEKESEKAPAERPAPAPITARAGERDTAIALSNIRKRTAEHMTRSKATSAHVYVSIEVDYEGVERVRRAQKDRWRADEGFGLTYLPFVSRAVVDAIREFPEVNATLGETELIVHNYVNLGIAVDLDYKGLIVPVIHDADGKRLRALAREVSDLAGRARGKKLGADEISGGTFTITNPGPFGTTMTLPIINQPQVAILSTDGVKRRPVVVSMPDGSEGIAIHSVGNITLTWDHRAFDGAYASAFVAKVREIIETRDWAAEL